MDLKDIFQKANDPDSNGLSGQNPGADGDDPVIIDPKDIVGDDSPDVEKDDAGLDPDIKNPGAAPIEPSDDYDAEVLSLLFQAVSEKTGVELDDIDLKSPEDLVDAITKIIDSKSVPSYHNDLSREFDEFLRDGGDPAEFMASLGEDMTLPRVSSDEDREAVIRQVLTDAGFSEKQIERKIDSYIENGTLEEEAQDALDIIKSKKAKSVESAAKAKREAEAAAIKEQRDFIKSIETHIDGLTNVRGIPVTKEQAKNLKDYLLKVDKKDGLTAYQRESNSIESLIEAAFISQNKTTLLKAAESRGSSEALSKLQSLLKSKQSVSGSGVSQQGVSDELAPWLKQAAALTGRRAA